MRLFIDFENKSWPMHFVSFLVLQSSRWGSFYTLSVFFMPCGCICSLPLPRAAMTVGLYSDVVAFHGHIHFLKLIPAVSVESLLPAYK